MVSLLKAVEKSTALRHSCSAAHQQIWNVPARALRTAQLVTSGAKALPPAG